MDKFNLEFFGKGKQIPLVSVIIPVFNGEKYISKCLRSIASQTYNNLEIIIVNDGSQDRSLKICYDFKKTEQRAHIVNNDNHGVGYSRNYGLKIAKGEYIVFVDCDDIIPDNYIEEMTKALVLEERDLVICRLVDVYINDSEVIIKKRNRSIPKNLTNIFMNDYYKLYPETVYLSGPAAKIYKKSVIDKYNILFPDNLSWGEDQAFNQAYYKYVNTFSFITNTYYSYCHRDNFALTRRYDKKNFEERMLSIRRIKSFLNEMCIKNKEMILGDHCFNVIGVNDLIKSNEEDVYSEYIAYKERIKLLQGIVQKGWKGSNWQRKAVFFCFDKKIYFPFFVYAKLRRLLSKF